VANRFRGSSGTTPFRKPGGRIPRPHPLLSWPGTKRFVRERPAKETQIWLGDADSPGVATVHGRHSLMGAILRAKTACGAGEPARTARLCSRPSHPLIPRPARTGTVACRATSHEYSRGDREGETDQREARAYLGRGKRPVSRGVFQPRRSGQKLAVEALPG